MANGIAQFNIQFDALEDRLQLRVLSTNDEEIRLWLTRRYVRLLLKALNDKFGASQSGNDQARQDTERFSDPYMGTTETQLPLGEAPQLVSRIAIQDKDDGNVTLHLGQEIEGGMQIELGLNRQLVASLQAMLVEAAMTAEWDLAAETAVADFTEHLSGVVLH
jgi:hypothetical protein